MRMFTLTLLISLTLGGAVSVASFWSSWPDTASIADDDLQSAFLASLSGEPSPAAGYPLTSITGADDSSATSGISPALMSIIITDAERIGDWMSALPAVDIAVQGDLNDDGHDDAVVVLTDQSDQAAYGQYLLSYVTVEKGYELVSFKLMTDVSQPPTEAKVEDIDDGVIWVTLPDQDGSSHTETGYRLRDRNLVEVSSSKAESIGE